MPFITRVYIVNMLQNLKAIEARTIAGCKRSGVRNDKIER